MGNADMFAGLLIALLVVSVVGASTIRKPRWVVDDVGCRTPDNGVGNCIPLSQCRTLRNLVSSPKHSGELQKYHCSYQSSVISVCCPHKPVEIKEFPKSFGANVDLLPEDCGISNAIPRITFGQKTVLFEFPWQVALRYNDPVHPFGCGGTLINNRYVLTAGHCIKNQKLIGVRLGEHNFKTNPDCQTERNKTICAAPYIDIDVTNKDVVLHENYQNAYRHDIALIRLPRKVEFSQSISPVCLPIKEAYNKDLVNLTVIGWGRTETFKPSPILLKTTVPVMNINLCRSVFRGRVQINDNQFCAGGKDGKDSCTGDSGGPIMYTVVEDGEIKWVQAGIVSYGLKFCGMERVPAMYTKTSAYIDWILNNLRP